ncbi:ATP-dependent DNA helicase Pif1-like [Ranitomeya variabilis]|uniref:ATP-dependent DNA helicase Pif1-like n=1 Tax=Ranitomeya variabilis TaxID=490064 RepID=UPI0040559D2C
MFFLSDAGGCGKTSVYKALTSTILGNGGIVKTVAPTGLAATLLKGSKTVHSGFGISIHLNERTVSSIKEVTSVCRELRDTKLIIWDEISMSHVHLFNAIDRSLRILLHNEEPFGGIPIVVEGDFCQLAPVVLHGNRVSIVEACVKSSPVWKTFKELKLIRNMQVNPDEVEFCEWLLTVGSGVEDGNLVDFVKLSKDILTHDVMTSIFGNDLNSLTPADLASRAVLCPKNCDTLTVNEEVLNMLRGQTKSYFSVDNISSCETEEERAQYPIEFVHSLTHMGFPPHMLNLKKGCCVMLLRNLNPKKGLCNGTRLIVETLGTNLIDCSIFSGELRGQKVLIPRIPLDTSENCDIPFKLTRKQFPLRLAYSMTITKS